MKQAIELSGHKAEIDHIFSRLADGIWYKEDSLVVVVNLLEPVDGIGGTAGFGVHLPAESYTKEEFLKAVVREGEKQLIQIREQYAREKAKREQETTRKRRLEGIINDITRFLEG